MNKKIFLTSAAIMCMACPAIAESFPSDGNMVENETYANAAVYDNTGVYEGTATANAYYSTNEYNVSAGSYFTGLDNNNDATTATCTSGNYCPGVTNTTYDDVNSAFVDDGLQTCPNGYASSDLGASANTQCYRTCDIANMGENGTIANIAHAATLSGNDYYGNGADTCEPATCENGWHKKDENVNTVIGTTGYSSYGCVLNGSKLYQAEALGLTENNTYAVAYNSNKGTIYGRAICSTQSGSKGEIVGGTYPDITTFASLTDETGQEGAAYCYCNVTGYTPASGTLQSVSSSWVFGYDYPDASICASNCIKYCMEDARGTASYQLAYRAALLSTLPSNPATCEANTINITWNDADAADIAATGAATTVYEGDIKTPLKAITKPGKTFVGWKFVKPAATPVEPEQGEGD